MADGRNLVGVDIGASSIKVVQLRETRKRLSVVRFGIAALPPQTIVDGHIMNRAAVIEALSSIWSTQRIPARDVSIGVYGQSVIVRKITVPIMTAAELAEQITWEAEQHIPFDIKVMNIDYEVLRRRPEAGQMDLLLVAAKKDEINDYASVVREARIKPQIVDINAFSVQNAFEFVHGLPDDQTIALLNVGAAVSSLNIVSRGISAFTREVTNAGNTVTEEIQRQLGVSFEQAEQMKIVSSQGAAVPEQVHQVVSQACDALAGEIQRSLDFYLATSGEAEIQRIYVCGGSAYLAPLVSAVEKRARVPVMVLDPLATLAVDPKTVNEADLRGRAAQLCVAVGLALRTDRERRDQETRRVRVNLLAQRKETTRRPASEGSQAWLGVALVCVLLEIVGLFVWHSAMKSDLGKLTNDNAGVLAQIDKIKKDTSEHPAVKAQLAELKDREDAISKLQAARTGPTSVLLELSHILTQGRGPTVDHDKLEQLKRDDPTAVPNPNWDPRKLWLTKYTELDRSVKIEGLARDGEDIAEFMRRLGVSDLFYDVKPLPVSEASDKDTKINLKQFAVSAKERY
jgi:type IV pilus assembly protein PilM